MALASSMLFAQGVSALGAVCECFGRRAGGQRRVSALISVMMGVWSPTQCQWERRCARARYDPRQALTAEPLWLAEACRLTLARAARDGQRLQSLLGPRNTCGQRLRASTPGRRVDAMRSRKGRHSTPFHVSGGIASMSFKKPNICVGVRGLKNACLL